MSELRDETEKWLLARFQRLPRYARVLAVLVVLLAAFVLARNGIFGDGAQRLSQRLVGLSLGPLDPPRAAISLTFFAEHLTADGVEPVRLGESYPADSNMALVVDSSVACWLMIVGIDRDGPYAVFPQPGTAPDRAGYFEPGAEPMRMPFQLDGTTGEELFLAIAADHRFDYAGSVETALDAALRQPGRRGADLARALRLGEGFFQRAIHFSAY